MSRATLESVLARSLVEPAFLESLLADPARALRGLHLDRSSMAEFRRTDWDRVRLFSGFIGKVQHNHLWDSFPATRRLLCEYGLELEAFAQYRSRQLSPEVRAADAGGRIRGFVHFLADFASRRHCPGLLAALRHEEALWEMRRLPRAEAPVITAPPVAWAEYRRWIPTVRGCLALRQFEFDPVPFVDDVRRGRFQRKLPRRSRCVLGYWVGPAGADLSILRFDSLPAVTLSAINGRRSVSAVIARVRREGLEWIAPRHFRDFFRQSADRGLIYLHPPGES